MHMKYYTLVEYTVACFELEWRVPCISLNGYTLFMGYMETRQRTLAKTILYRVILIISDAIVVYYFTRRIDITLASIGFISIANTVIYYFYDRVWSGVKWGIIKRRG